MPGLGGGAGQPDGQHRLPGTRRPDEHHVAGVVEEPQRGQLTDEFLVDAGLSGEVERVQTGLRWQAAADSSTACLAVTPPRSRASLMAARRTASDSALVAIPSSFAAMVPVASAVRSRAFAITCGAAPPCTRHTFMPCFAGWRHRSPFLRCATQRFRGAGSSGAAVVRGDRCRCSSRCS